MRLTAPAIRNAQATVPLWQRRGARLRRTVVTQDFRAALKFVTAVAKLAETAGHHPDLTIRWNKVTLTLTTHDAGGLTERDFALARQIDQLKFKPAAR